MTDKHGPQPRGKRPSRQSTKRPECMVRNCNNPVKNNQTVCQHCIVKLSANLGRMTGWADDLAITFTRTSKMADSNGSSKAAETALPFDDRARREADALARTLFTWARRISQKRGLERGIGPECLRCHHRSCKLFRITRGPGDNPLSAARWLLLNVSWVSRYDLGPAFVEDIASASSRVAYVVDRRPDRWYAGTCWAETIDEETNTTVACSEELYAKPDASEIKCRRCNTEHDVNTRREWLLKYAEDMLAPAGLIARAVTRLGEQVTPYRIHQWKRRGKIVVHEVDDDGHELFRVGDVIDLAHAHAEAEAKRLAKDATRPPVSVVA